MSAPYRFMWEDQATLSAAHRIKKYIETLVMVTRNDFETPNSLAVKSSAFFFPFLLTTKLPKVTNKQNEGSKYQLHVQA